MTPALRSLAVALAAGVLVASATRPVHALGPSVLMFYGGSLASPVFVTGADAGLFGNLLAASNVPQKDMAGRSYLKVAAFWGPASDPALRGTRALADLRPDMAWQHGKYYPATATQPAVLVVTPLHVKRASGLPDFEHAALFSWGGALSPGAASAAQAATASVRVSHR